MGAGWSRPEEQQGSVEVTGTVAEGMTPSCNGPNRPSRLNMLQVRPQWDCIWRWAFKEAAKFK